MDRHSKEFRQLQAKWYKRLEQSGFDDIEYTQYEENQLRDYHADHFAGRSRLDDVSAIEEYYRLAGQFLYSYPFESKKEQTIWQYHSEGLSVIKIVDVMKARRFKVYRRLVDETIRRLRQEMMKK